MIIARGDDKASGDQLLILGLSNENVRRLVAGQPISLSQKTHGDGIPKGWQIVIMFGRTEADMAKDLESAIGPDTIIHRDPRL